MLAVEMEMHQVQYFLAVARTRNFTRASEECNVSQPSLSRAIKLLEAELGGDLFVRERPAAQLTTLGQYMRPLLAQCYESALSARSLADAIRKQAVGSLTLVLSRSVDIAPLAVPLARLQSQFGRLQLRLLRGQGDEITSLLKAGEADLAIASALDTSWDRLDCWPLYDEPFLLAVSPGHRLANNTSVSVHELGDERLVLRPYCDHSREVLALFRERGLAFEDCDEIASEEDLVALLGAKVGAAVVPRSLPDHGRLVRLQFRDIQVHRTVSLYGVAGRQRTPAASAV
ncbi:MAG: LysR family transcriptional regulator, partial [Mangrovicoccus sp.]|nr:LysR family transcriptional regulator [Mangrovicoccus sp.]